ncbi:MAG: hypothetical protein LM632_13390 [Armatimonadetes bacterium]|nr:hypothetical protein [Armatimonadota bacterium]
MALPQELRLSLRGRLKALYQPASWRKFSHNKLSSAGSGGQFCHKDFGLLCRLLPPFALFLPSVQAIIVAVNEDGARRVAGIDGEGVAETASGAP